MSTARDLNPAKYAYNYSHLPPLAMVDVVPPAEAFSARPDWIALAAVPALRILINSIMIRVRSRSGNIEFVQQVLAELRDVARQLSGDAGRDLNQAIDMELGKRGSPTSSAQLN